MNIGDYYNTHDFYLGIAKPLHDWVVGLGLPAWIVAIVYAGVGAVAALGLITVLVMLALWAERRFIARLQDRWGPNRVGPFGLMQSPADVLKLLTKEIITPAQVDKTLHFLAPMIVLGPALMTWAVIPFGPGLQVSAINVGIRSLLAFGALPTLVIMIAGWAS